MRRLAHKAQGLMEWGNMNGEFMVRKKGSVRQAQRLVQTMKPTG